MSLTVLAIADGVSDALYTHFRPEAWRKVDLVVSCGDLPPTYLDLLATTLAVPVVYVRGNHDWSYAAEEYAGCENAHGRIVEVKGVRIAGFEGCVRYNTQEYQYTERQMARIVRKVERRARRAGTPDILLTHAPPKGPHEGSDRVHQGFACFTQAIELWRPAYAVHGHTHQYERIEPVTELGDTTLINAYPYRMFQIEPRPVTASNAPERRLPALHLPHLSLRDHNSSKV
jgi:Icc-related predicted phosphoesterase